MVRSGFGQPCTSNLEEFVRGNVGFGLVRRPHRTGGSCWQEMRTFGRRPTTALHLDMASTHAQERLLDAAFEDFATSLVGVKYPLPVSS